jgi:hypothetical protein
MAKTSPVNTSSSELDSARHDRDARASEIEAVADHLVALVEEFEIALSEGRVPSAFAERLTELRHTAERLIGT